MVLFPALILVIGLVAAFLFKSHKVIIDAKVILIFTVIELLAIIVSFTELSDSGSLDSVARPDYGEGDETRILQVGHDGQWEDIEIDISEKDMPSGVSGELLSEALEDIQAEYLGDYK